MKIRYILSSAMLAALALASCTNLDEELFDKVSMNDYGKTEAEVQTIVGGAYATLRGYGSGTPEGNGVICYPTCEYVFFTSECSSDEACLPTRGTDWYDGGRYQQLQFHTWDANNTGILSVWRYNFTGVSKVNAIIYQVEQSELSAEAKKKVEAELRGLRAYYYYNLLDNFGNVPISTDFTQSELPANATRQEPHHRDAHLCPDTPRGDRCRAHRQLPELQHQYHQHLQDACEEQVDDRERPLRTAHHGAVGPAETPYLHNTKLVAGDCNTTENQYVAIV